ncbi:Mannosyl oligosaccharide glucosidase [Planctomycetes bacterium CA13]|uniref:Mannosyl oligosaccharide glucosidase n=1 Tax=Novipirellula herctigrandis TaxID=2527986 RepID=A0A5C5Z6N6_9BACT|nr:Mannosyl oligosaccharide glucosidase [Planctomycetes bacterium CA13]
MPINTAERARLKADHQGLQNWRAWGPYVSERSWGTVREDYSEDGNAWDYLTHNHARSKAYRWGEDGLAGICDRYQLLVFALALWNGEDPFLKERLFGLTPDQANHGEDVKEYYFYLDALPSSAYLKYLYKYPQAQFPYQQLLVENSRRNRQQREYELIDTGIFDDDRYFDVFVEYAKENTHDLCVRIEVFNRGPEPAPIWVLPHLWFRNTWAWETERQPEPILRMHGHDSQSLCLVADSSNVAPLGNLLFPYKLDNYYLQTDASSQPLFTNNETNQELLYGVSNESHFVKDAFHRHFVDKTDCVNHELTGTKACIDYGMTVIEPAGSKVFRLRLSNQNPLDQPSHSLSEVDEIVAKRRAEADEFYAAIHPPKASADECLIQRQALAGMLWTKQIYLFDVQKWLDGDNAHAPPAESRRKIRNHHWRHLNSMRILSMPDKWEYPWFAAWDLAFHCIPLTLVDPEFAKEQLWLLLFEQFQHPNGQIPAYEWEFSDLNPPVHAWAVWRVYNMDRIRNGCADREFLERCFHKLMLNFTWWINKVDSEGHNVFEGGFLGLDNISSFDRSERPDDGATLKQADATGWMGMYCLNMMRIALALAKENPAYVGLATKFFEHYTYIGSAMKNMGGRSFQLWSDNDGMFCDVLSYPDGSYHRFHLRSLVNLIPLYAVERLEDNWIEQFPLFRDNLLWCLRNRASMTQACMTENKCSAGDVLLLSLVDQEQFRRILQRIADPDEFLSPFGLRSLSKHHADHPYSFNGERVQYEAAESTTWLKGGNSNWRGPVWFPTTFLMIESLRRFAQVYEGEMHIQTSEGAHDLTLIEMAADLANRMISLFARDASGRRAFYGDNEKFQSDPHWRDCLLFHEYFHSETGEGLGASHQTGWTGLVASLIDEWRR